MYQQLKIHQKALGGILAVEEGWLLLRGVKTMGLRMEKSILNAQAMAEYLQQKPQIKQVYYPGLATHRGYETHQKQAKNGGAVLSFELASEEHVHQLFENCQLPIVAVSLGGVESILSLPWCMSHASMPEEERLKMGITPTLVRLSCGIEDIEDLIADFEQALQS